MHQQQEITAAKPLSALDAFNFIKVIAMIGMPFIHILENYESIGVLSEECYRFTDLVFALTVFGPSVFMFCMGLGMAKDTSSKRLFKNGVQMLIISLLFNIVRLSIPGMAAVAVGMVSWVDLLCNTISSDIYSFVGIFYIFYSFVIQFKLSPKNLLVVSIIMLLFNCIIASFDTQEVTLLTTLSGHFVSIAYNSYFPLMGWAIYPCLGIFTAKKLPVLSEKENHKAFAFIGLIGIVLLTIAVPFLKTDIVGTLSEFAFFSYYRWTHAGLIMSITFITLAAVCFLFQSIRNNLFISKIISFAPFLLPFYIFQWLATSLVSAYYCAIHFLLTETHACIHALDYLLISIVVTILCIILTYKKGFSFSRWLFKISDYTRWGKKHAEV